LSISLPIEKGLYAITGQNGSGKSTIVACASTVFFNMPMKEYFGETADDASISFSLNGATRKWGKTGKSWIKQSSGNMNLKGFYEGSLIFGYRFRNTSYDKLKKLDYIDEDKLIPADDFIRVNLGKILQGDENFYEKMWVVSKNYAGFDGNVFFYEKNGRRISQFHMSTGENLLVSVLNSINIRNEDRASLSKPCVIFLDEIELALHPSSLKRLVDFMKQMSEIFNYAIYFSTHSIELIRGIKPDNIFYIERHADNSIEIINPCYPAYATKFLYDHSGYDNIFLVEDDLTKEIIGRIIKKEQLLGGRLVHVLPCGGYNNVIDLSQDVTSNNLLGKLASISIILDGDVEKSAKEYRVKRGYSNSIPLNFLPIESLEKYLKKALYLNVDHQLFRKLEDYVFLQKSLKEIVDEYSKNHKPENDKDGKTMYKLIDSELRARNKSRSDLIEVIVDFLFENNGESLTKLINFLKEQLSK
jgi:energy-coupling factor transporter ATP-binding protein EcfA2